MFLLLALFFVAPVQSAQFQVSGPIIQVSGPINELKALGYISYNECEGNLVLISVRNPKSSAANLTGLTGLFDNKKTQTATSITVQGANTRFHYLAMPTAPHNSDLQVKELDLSGCTIGTIPTKAEHEKFGATRFGVGGFEQPWCAQLTKVTLADCSIKGLNAGCFAGLIGVATLDLRNNSLTDETLKLEIFDQCKKLKTVFLAGNPCVQNAFFMEMLRSRLPKINFIT